MSDQAERIQTGRLREDPVSKLLLQFSFPEKMFPHAAILKRIALLGTPQFFLQLAGAVTNIIPDPVFIFGFGWGMNGAAFEKRELPITIFSPRAPVSDTKTD